MPAYITIVGNLGADAETAQAGDTPVTRWRVASTTKGRNGEPDHTAWFRVTIWRGWDSHAAARKGDAVTVTGELSTRDYQGQPQLEVSAQPWLCQAPRREAQQQGGGKSDTGRGGQWGGGGNDGW